MKIRRLPLSEQLAISVLSICFLVFSALVIALSVMSDRSALASSESQLNQQMSAIAGAIEDNMRGAQDTARLRLDVFKLMLGGEIRLARETAPAGDVSDVRIIKAGNLVLNNNLDFLSHVRDVVGADPAVMVLHEDKFLRVATLLKDPEGKSMVGSFLPENGAETKALKEGKSYFGLVTRGGKFYLSILEPLFDNDERIIGALSVRVGIDDIVSRLSESLKRIKIGETGYAFTFAPAADLKQTRMMIHPTLAGKTLADINSPLVDGIIGQMSQLKDGVLYYDWIDSRTGASGKKIAAVATVKSVNWIVAAGSWVDELTAETRHLRNLLVAAAIISAALIIAVVIWVARSRLRAITDMVQVMRKMGDGDLRHAFPAIDPMSRCETDLLNSGLARMQASMSEMIGKIHESARKMTGATQALGTASNRVAAGSESQSTSSSSLAAAVEQLSVSINHVSSSADDAQKLSLDASNAAHCGNRQVSEVAGDMARIDGEIRDAASVVHRLGEQTARISDVIEVIKDVADQTNLLALNAAIEAARAGEAGRGFAVVADEVRKLAEHTTRSAGEISSSIGSVQHEAQEVVRRIEQVAERVSMEVRTTQSAGEVLRQIELQSQKAVAAISAIAESMREQSAASQEIARGVENISQMAESNSEAAQENQASAEALRVMADEMEAMVSRFHT